MLKEQLMKDLKQAMIEKDILKKDTITMLRAAILQIEKDKMIELSENEMFEVASKEIKKRNDAIPDFEKAGREASVNALKREIEILKQYLPQQLTQDEINKIVQNAINELQATSIKQMGSVMQIIKPQILGKTDGRVVSDTIKAILK